ncbi:MAG: heat-inducible transcriptional repressor HrcA [Pseudoclavibacter sp.]
MATERGLAVLQAIVNDYVATREPVGSAGLVSRHQFHVSAATIRNDMSALEDEELISAPHTSAGRVPTEKGYRVFVDNLTRLRGITAPQRRAIERFLTPGEADLDVMIEKTVRLLAQLTNQLAVVRYPTFSSTRVRKVDIVDVEGGRLLVVLITSRGTVAQHHVTLPAGASAQSVRPSVVRLRALINDQMRGVDLEQFGDRAEQVREYAAPDDRPLAELLLGALELGVEGSRSERLVVAGTGNLMRTEADFDHTLVPVLEAIEEQVALLRLLGEMGAERRDITVRIGRENEHEGLEEAAVISSGYGSEQRGEYGRLAVLGPTRMDYRANMAAVQAVASYLSKMLR